MQYTRTEVAVGAFVLVGAAALAYLSLSVGGLQLLPAKRYAVMARFAEVGGLGEGAPIRVAGVAVGKVDSISLENYAALVRLDINDTVELPSDTIASVRTSGLLGETFISLSPGSSAKNLASGDRIMQTEPAIDLLELIENYAFGGQGIEEEGASPSKSPFEDPLE